MEADNAEDNCTNAVDTEIDDTEETQPDDGKQRHINHRTVTEQSMLCKPKKTLYQS